MKRNQKRKAGARSRAQTRLTFSNNDQAIVIPPLSGKSLDDLTIEGWWGASFCWRILINGEDVFIDSPRLRAFLMPYLVHNHNPVWHQIAYDLSGGLHASPLQKESSQRKLKERLSMHPDCPEGLLQLWGENNKAYIVHVGRFILRNPEHMTWEIERHFAEHNYLCWALDRPK